MQNQRIVFKGTIYRGESKDKYYRANWTPEFKTRYLHREIWKDAHGEIPSGCVIHHKDGNQLNNEIENLECKQSFCHASHHGKLRKYNPNHLREIVHLAKEWHRSSDGFSWHSKHARDNWKKKVIHTAVCNQCEKIYEAKTLGQRKTDRFCSNKCKSAWRRASGKDDTPHICAECRKDFFCNKYNPRKCCSRSCALAYKRAHDKPCL